MGKLLAANLGRGPCIHRQNTGDAKCRCVAGTIVRQRRAAPDQGRKSDDQSAHDVIPLCAQRTAIRSLGATQTIASQRGAAYKLAPTSSRCSARRPMTDNPETSLAPFLSLRDDNEQIRREFVERVEQAIAAADAAALHELVGNLHEADMGDVLEALDPELRPRLIELMGREFDFTALTEVDEAVRDDILEELPSETVAQGLREIESDDAVEILKDLPKE